MKRRYFGMMSLAALAMTFGSCQLNEPDTIQSGEVEFSLTAGIPSGISTYAQPDLQSHFGGATNLDKEKYDLRYILEAWTIEETPRLAYRKTITSDDFGKVTFEARLLAKKYNFVFWADFVQEDKTDNLVYNADELTAITYADKNNRYAGKDEADAYYGVVDVDLTKSGESVGQVTLKRPFGKIRLVATDAVEGMLEDRPVMTAVSYGADLKVPSVFNALEKKVVAGETIPAGEYDFKAQIEDAVVEDKTYEGAYVIGYDYIFASDATPSYSFTSTVYGDEAKANQLGYRELSQIPVQENKLTTVIGNFYTNVGTIDVVIEDAFDEYENIPMVDDAKSLQAAIDNAEDGDVIVLGSGVYDFSSKGTSGSAAIQLPKDKSLTFRGANAGIAGASAERGEETIVMVPFVFNHTEATTADFVFDGIKFSGSAVVSLGKASASSVTIENCVMDNLDFEGCFMTTPCVYVWDYTMKNIIIRNNYFNGEGMKGPKNDSGFRIWRADNVEFEGNTFESFRHNVAWFYEITGTVSIRNNEFRSCTYQWPVRAEKNKDIPAYTLVNEGNTEGHVFVTDDWSIVPELPAYVTDGEELLASLGNEMIVLANDITMEGALSEIAGVLDLNGHTLTLTATGNTVVKEGKSVVIRNGNFDITRTGSPANNIFVQEKGSSLLVENVEMKADFEESNAAGSVFHPKSDAGELVIRKSTVETNKFVITTNVPSTDDRMDIVVEGSSLKGRNGIIAGDKVNVRIDDSEVYGYGMQAVIIRSANAEISNSTLTLDYYKDNYDEMSHWFDNRNWGSTNAVNIAALTIGNKNPERDQYPSNVSLVNTEVKLLNNGKYFPAVYVHANEGDGLGVTFNYDAQCSFDKMPEYGSANIKANGVDPIYNETKAAAYGSIQEAVAGADAGDVIALAPGTYTELKGVVVDKQIHIKGAEGRQSVIASARNSSYGIYLKKGADVAGTVLENLVVYGAYMNNGDGVSNAIAIFATGTQDRPVVIRNCETRNPGIYAAGVKGYNGISTTYGDFRYMQIENNTILDARYGMYFNSLSNSTVKGNDVQDAACGGIVIAADSEKFPCADVAVENNTLTGVSYAGYNSVYCYALSVPGSYGTNLTEQNNTVEYAAGAASEMKEKTSYGFNE